MQIDRFVHDPVDFNQPQNIFLPVENYYFDKEVLDKIKFLDL
jgi:hypothetical protein